MNIDESTTKQGSCDNSDISSSSSSIRSNNNSSDNNSSSSSSSIVSRKNDVIFYQQEGSTSSTNSSLSSNSANHDNENYGNELLIRLIYKYQPVYLKSPEPIQKTIVRDIVKEIHNLNPPGRFFLMKKQSKDDGENNDKWIVLNDKKARSFIHKELNTKERKSMDNASSYNENDDEDNSNSNGNIIGDRNLNELQSYVLFVPSCGCIIQNNGSHFLKRLVCERRLLFQHEYTSETTQNFLIQDIIKATKFMILSSDNNKWRSLNKDDIPLVTKVIQNMLYSSTDNIFGSSTTTTTSTNIIVDETNNDNDDEQTRVVTNRSTTIMNHRHNNNNNIAGLCYLPISRYL